MWLNTKNIIRGKVVAPPSSNHGESCESMFACGSSMHQKFFNYALTNLFGLCKSVWIIDMLVTCFSLHLGAPTRPSTFEVLRTREHTPTSYPSTIFTFGLIVESIKEFGGASIMVQNMVLMKYLKLFYSLVLIKIKI